MTDFRQRLDEASNTTIALSSLMALIIGGLCAWAFSSMGLALVAFLLGAALSGYHLLNRRNGWLVTGRGLHISAGVLFFLPVMFYLPTVLASSTSETAAGAGAFIGSLLGIIIWGVVFFFLAALCGVIGYLCNRKGVPVQKTSQEQAVHPETSR